MDILDRLLGHDAWTTREMLARCEGLSDGELDRKFEIGHGSLRATFVHMIWNIEVWSDLMCERRVRERPGKGEETIARLMARLDAAAEEFGAMSQRTRDEGRLDDLFADTVESPAVMYSFGGGIAHVITHSMHHRAQILNIMRQLGMRDLIEGDALSWEGAHRAGGWPKRGEL
ncbi:MAG TPA: DinB family protein [Tepidisphaeraceae bacterium]|jgi:uncharacterized damage-inducible protein DinB|nr:DinB family protein [Tepidisphaeraceae bacterium]